MNISKRISNSIISGVIALIGVMVLTIQIYQSTNFDDIFYLDYGLINVIVLIIVCVSVMIFFHGVVLLGKYKQLKALSLSSWIVILFIGLTLVSILYYLYDNNPNAIPDYYDNYTVIDEYTYSYNYNTDEAMNDIWQEIYSIIIFYWMIFFGSVIYAINLGISLIKNEFKIFRVITIILLCIFSFILYMMFTIAFNNAEPQTILYIVIYPILILCIILFINQLIWLHMERKKILSTSDEYQLY